MRAGRRLRHRFQKLASQVDWLTEKINRPGTPWSQLNHLKAERSAIEWAMELALEKYPNLDDPDPNEDFIDEERVDE